MFRNDSDTDHTVPYMEKRTSVTTVDAEIQAEMQFEMVDNTMAKQAYAELNLQCGSFYTNEEKVEMQLRDVTLCAGHAVAVQDTLHKTQNDIEVRALAVINVYILDTPSPQEQPLGEQVEQQRVHLQECYLVQE